MSWSIVRTCGRCGTRAERLIRTGTQVERAVLVLRYHLQYRDSDDGCPSCDPELARAAGVDMDEWRESVNRALGHRAS